MSERGDAGLGGGPSEQAPSTDAPHQMSAPIGQPLGQASTSGETRTRPDPVADLPTVVTAQVRPSLPPAPTLPAHDTADAETVPAMPMVTAPPRPAPPAATTFLSTLPPSSLPPRTLTAPPRLVAMPATPTQAPTPSTSARTPTRRSAGRKALAPLWWVLIAALVLLAATSWTAYAAYRVPASVVASVCADLSHGSADALYKALAPSVRAVVSPDEFATVFHAATNKTQAIQQCARTGAYRYLPGQSSASAQVTITRASGQRISGTVELVNVGGAWWVDALSPALLGVDVSALATANRYCLESTTANTSGLYALQGAALRQGVSLPDFTAIAKLHTTIDGAITQCAVTGLDAASTPQRPVLDVSLTWARLGKQSGTLTLANEGGSWVIDALSASLRGSDLGALTVADRFCSDAASGAVSDAYSLFAAAFRGQASEQDFAAVLNGSKTGLKYSGCQVDASTFRATASSASVQAQLSVTTLATHQTYTVPITLPFVLESGAWRISGLVSGLV